MFLINPYILQASGNPLWNGLLAGYNADNTSNDVLNVNNGTLVNGATYGSGKINQAFSFDGVNDYLDFPSKWFRLSKTESFTISVWVYRNGAGTYTVFANGADTGHFFYIESGYVWCQIANSGSNQLHVRTTTTFPLTTWTHITVRYNGTPDINGFTFNVNNSVLAKTYVNNTLTSDTPNPAQYVPNIGRRPNGQYYYNGLLDMTYIWNRFLTDAEITELYNSGAGKQHPN